MNITWRLKFPDAMIVHLPCFILDYRPLFVQLSRCNMIKMKHKPSHFLAFWILQDYFLRFINTNWRRNNGWSSPINQFRVELLKWNDEYFRQIGTRKTSLTIDEAAEWN